jgi:hypothetical protein
MNIPAELVMVANTCDMYGLRHEADVLTEIARHLIQQQDATTETNNITILEDN